MSAVIEAPHLANVMEQELRDIDDYVDRVCSMCYDKETWLDEMYNVDSLSGMDVCLPFEHASTMQAFDVNQPMGLEVMRMTAGRGGDIYKKITQKYALIKIWHSSERNVIVFLGGSAVARADAIAEVSAKMRHNMHKKLRQLRQRNRNPIHRTKRNRIV